MTTRWIHLTWLNFEELHFHTSSRKSGAENNQNLIAGTFKFPDFINSDTINSLITAIKWTFLINFYIFELSISGSIFISIAANIFLRTKILLEHKIEHYFTVKNIENHIQIIFFLSWIINEMKKFVRRAEYRVRDLPYTKQMLYHLIHAAWIKILERGRRWIRK